MAFYLKHHHILGFQVLYVTDDPNLKLFKPVGVLNMAVGARDLYIEPMFPDLRGLS